MNARLPARRASNPAVPRPRNVAGRAQGGLRLNSPNPSPTNSPSPSPSAPLLTTGVWSRIGKVTTWVGAVGVAVAAFTGVWFSYQQSRIAEQGQVTDRFAKAVEQLGSLGPDKIDVRLGGIYSLERLARDSRADQPAIIEVLSAYVRGQAPASGSDSSGHGHCEGDSDGSLAMPIDIQAAVTVLGRRNPDADGPTIHFKDSEQPPEVNLSASCLVLVRVVPAHLEHANLSHSDLRQAFLPDADLRGAHFGYATLTSAVLQSADLGSADLSYADLGGKANLFGANLTGANLTGANLSGADLTLANLAGVSYDYSTQWPTGFRPPPSS
jgi:hypothetical protein